LLHFQVEPLGLALILGTTLLISRALLSEYWCLPQCSSGIDRWMALRLSVLAAIVSLAALGLAEWLSGKAAQRVGGG